MAQIIKRNSKWQYRIFYNNVNGIQKSKSKSGFRTKSECETEAREVEYQLKNRHKILSKEPFSVFYKKWIDTYKQDVGEITQSKYLKSHELISSNFNTQTIDEISAIEYQKLINELGKKYSLDTMQHINSYYRSAVKFAINEGYATKDFTFNAKVTGIPEKDDNLKYIELDEAKKLEHLCLQNISINKISTIQIIFGLLTGCRYSEVAGLTWDCVDLSKGTITINKTFDYKHQSTFKSTKTKSSIRTISINKTLIDILKWLKINSTKTNSLNLVFINEYEKINSNNAVNK